MVAKFSVIIVSTTNIVASIVLSAIVLIFRVGLSELFTSDTEVIEAVSNLTPLLAATVFLNGIQPILWCGNWEWMESCFSYVNLSTYCIVGLPIAYVLGFKTSLRGVWWGMVAGVLRQTLTLLVSTVRTSWNAEVAKAAECLKKSGNEERQDVLDSI